MDRSSSRRAGAKWRRTRGLAVLVALGGLLAGCASAPIQAPVASMAPPSGGTARIVVIRPEKGLPQLMDMSFNVKLDGVSMGDVLTGTIIAADRPAGPHQLTADLWDTPGVTRHDFTAAPGKTYYFAARLDENAASARAVGMVSGATWLLMSVGQAAEGRGPVQLIPLGEAEARGMIARLQKTG